MIRRLLFTVPLLFVAGAASAQSHLLVVSGLGGEPRYEASFHQWAMTMADAARKGGLPADNVVVLTDKPERDPAKVNGRSTRDAVLGAIGKIAGRAGPADAVFILLIGHGSADGETSRLNLSGPDLTAEELATALDAFRTQKVAVINTASASGGFIGPLTGRNRAIVTSTSAPQERNEAIFGGFFVEAFAGDRADTDKDGRVSLLEAFDYARAEVERAYERDNKLLTEHALIEDDGNGTGSRQGVARDGDGALARTLFLNAGRGAATAAAAASSPELQGLVTRRTQLEGEVEELRARRADMPVEEYQRELERLLLELARVSQEIRERGGAE